MRTLSSACAVTAAAAAVLLLSPTAHATSPGDNGTVKIHDVETGVELRKNEPKVCDFYLDGFGFDAEQRVEWRIVQMPPTGTKDTEAKSGALTLDVEGNGRTDALSLPDGHYKLVWNFDGENGRAKHKVFWVDCEEGEQASDEVSASPAPATEPNGGGDDLAETGASVTGLAIGAALLLGAGGWLMMRRRARSQG